MMGAAEDWARTRSARGKKTEAPKVRQKRYYDCRCVKCGMNYMTEAPPSEIAGALDERGGFLCINCRVKRGETERFIPPPMQLSLFDTKK